MKLDKNSQDNRKYKIFKELLQINKKKTKQKIWQKIGNTHMNKPKKTIDFKKCKFCSSQKMQIKVAMYFHFIHIRVANI